MIAKAAKAVKKMIAEKASRLMPVLVRDGGASSGGPGRRANEDQARQRAPPAEGPGGGQPDVEPGTR